MDANQYINAYVDIAVGTIHEHLSQILSLKTRLKGANDTINELNRIIGEKDAQLTEMDRTIGEQNKIIEDVDIEAESKGKTIEALTIKVQSLENSLHAITQKSSHLDSCLNTVVEMKKQIKERDDKIASLELKLTSPKKINRKKPTVTEEPVTVVDREPEDDF